MCNISDNIQKSGILFIQHSFKDIKWDKFYGTAKEIDLALFHGLQTLHYAECIREASSSSNPPSIRVKFPNYHNSSLIKQIATFENKKPESIINDIKDSISLFNEISKECKNSKITIYMSNIMFPFSIYKSDNRSIVLLSKKPSDKKPVIIKCHNKGSFYDYIDSHFQMICNGDGDKNNTITYAQFIDIYDPKVN